MKMKLKIATVYGFRAVGPSVAEARKKAIADIEKTAEGDYTPKVIRWRGMVGVVYRTPPADYAYLISYPDDGEGCRRTPCTCHCLSEEDAIRSVRWHMAQNAWSVADGIPAPAIIEDAHDRAEHETWAAWQIGCAAHQKAFPNATDDECRDAGDVALARYREERWSSPECKQE